MGASVLPRLPLHGGDRNRTSPFAFTGNKFEFRALGSLDVAGACRTPCSTRSSPRRSTTLADKLDAATSGGASLEEGVLDVVKDAWTENKRIVFSGDNYSDEWHAEAEQRGLANLEQSPEALPWLIEPSTVEVFGRYEVLSERELHSRYEVAVEQYITTINIEGETAASIARTMLLPAAVRWLGTLKRGRHREARARSPPALVDEFVERDLRARDREPRPPRGRPTSSTRPSTSRSTVHPRDGRRARGRRQARADRARRPLAAPEVLGDPLHQVGRDG